VVLNYKYGAAGTAVRQELSTTIPAYAVIPASAALAPGSVDTSKRGFIWRIHQVESDTILANSKSRALSQLNGQLGANIADPAAVGAAESAAPAASPATAPIEFKVASVINFSQTENENNGNFTPDLQMPGVPGTSGGNNNIAAAALAALEFSAAGTYSMIVNSDDGFETVAGKNPNDVFATQLGIYEGGRGASDTVFNFFVEAPGLYAFVPSGMRATAAPTSSGSPSRPAANARW
jgi:hypothetical protein